MAHKIEGTFLLDGLLEGRLFSDADERNIRRFVDETRKDGLLFYSKIDRNRFSLLPSQQSCKEKTFEVSVDSLLKGHLETLLGHYSPEECAKFMSTLRSVEYIKDFEKQAIYGIDAHGRVVVEKRTIPADTVPPEKEMTLKQKFQFFGFAAVVVLLAFLVSSIFVPYKKLIFSVIEDIKPYDLEQLDVSGQFYSEYFFLKEASLNSKDRTLVLVFKTTAAFPSTNAQLNDEWLGAAHDMEKRLAVEAVARRSLRCILFDKEGTYYSEYTARMIWDEERNEFALIVPFVKSLGKIELGY